MASVKKTICTNYATVAWSHLIEKKYIWKKKGSLLPFTFCLQIKNTSIYLLKHFHKILKQPLASIFLLLHKKICNSIQLQLESFYCIYFHKIKSESALFYKSDCFCLLVWFLSLMFILPVSTLQHWLLQLFFPLDKTFFQFTCSEVGSVRVVLISVMQRSAVFHSWVINFLNILSYLGGTGIYISIPIYIYIYFFSAMYCCCLCLLVCSLPEPTTNPKKQPLGVAPASHQPEGAEKEKSEPSTGKEQGRDCIASPRWAGFQAFISGR